MSDSVSEVIRLLLINLRQLLTGETSFIHNHTQDQVNLTVVVSINFGSCRLCAGYPYIYCLLVTLKQRLLNYSFWAATPAPCEPSHNRVSRHRTPQSKHQPLVLNLDCSKGIHNLFLVDELDFIL